MIKEYKEKFPSWCSDIAANYDLVIGDDIDSVLTANFLEVETWNSTRYFYDFKDFYIEKEHQIDNKVIGCDIDFTFANMRSWGNHVTAISNADYIAKNSANLNNIDKISSSNYTKKYAGSTFATVLSYYNFDISKLSHEAKMLILAIDSHYKGFYSGFHLQQKKWLVDVLEFQELYDIIKDSTAEDFIELQKEYSLYGKVWIDENGYLETNIDLEGISDVLGMDIRLPSTQFINHFVDDIELKTAFAGTQLINHKDSITENIFSYSQTYKNSASYTYLVVK